MKLDITLFLNPIVKVLYISLYIYIYIYLNYLNHKILLYYKLMRSQEVKGEVTARSQQSNTEVKPRSQRGHTDITARSQEVKGDVPARSRADPPPDC